MAKPLGLDLTQAADGILRIATTKMSHMVRWVTTERGLDAADFTLVAYGGAGPLHAAMVARELRIAKVVIPRAPGHFSAYGMLVADLRRDFVNTWFNAARRGIVRRPSKTIYAEMERRGREAIADSGLALAGVAVQRAADMRYVGQEHAVTVELPVDLFRAAGSRRHQAALRCRARDALRLFGAGREGRDRQPAQRRHRRDAQARVRAHRRPAKPNRRRRRFAASGRSTSPKPGGTSTRRPMTVRRCSAGNRIAGPALIEEYASTTVVHPGDVVDGRCLRRPRDRDSAELTMDAARESASQRPAAYRIDPVTTEIVRNGLIAATEEMKTNLMRTAYNMIIYEALDFTVGLFDAQGNTVSIGLGLPMFIRGMSDTVKTKLAHYGVENLEPGDILLTNDAYITGSHLNHMTFTVPIFHDGELVAFSCCMAHWPDVGGTLDGATTDIYSEGLQMPIVKIYRKGVHQRRAGLDHPHQCAAARTRDGRFPRPDRGGEDRRAALPRNDPEIRPRRRGRRHRGDHGPQRGG